jgi:hypothetical protein
VRGSMKVVGFAEVPPTVIPYWPMRFDRRYRRQ